MPVQWREAWRFGEECPKGGEDDEEEVVNFDDVDIGNLTRPEAVRLKERVEQQSHADDCGVRLHSSSECTCGKADLLSELEDFIGDEKEGE